MQQNCRPYASYAIERLIHDVQRHNGLSLRPLGGNGVKLGLHYEELGLTRSRLESEHMRELRLTPFQEAIQLCHRTGWGVVIHLTASFRAGRVFKLSRLPISREGAILYLLVAVGKGARGWLL